MKYDEYGVPVGKAQKERCPECNGTGERGDDNDCMNCFGTGEVEVDDEDPVFDDADEMEGE